MTIPRITRGRALPLANVLSADTRRPGDLPATSAPSTNRGRWPGSTPFLFSALALTAFAWFVPLDRAFGDDEPQGSAVFHLDSLANTRTYLLNDEENWRSDKGCGRVAAYVFLKLMGKEQVTFQDVAKDLPVDKSKGSNFFAIKQLMEKYGVKTQILEMTPAELTAEAKPVIVHLVGQESPKDEPGHFATLLRVDGRSAYLIDPSVSTDVMRIDSDTLFRAFSGFALCASRDTLFGGASGPLLVALLFANVIIYSSLILRRRPFRRAAPGGPGLGQVGLLSAALYLAPGCDARPGTGDARGGPAPAGGAAATNAGVSTGVGEEFARVLDTPVTSKDLGMLNGTNVSYDFPIRNKGPKPVSFEIGDPSCNCTQVRLGRHVLPPGESTTLSMTFHSSLRPGLSTAEVYLGVAGQPGRQAFRIRGFTRGVVVPDAIKVIRDGDTFAGMLIGSACSEGSDDTPSLSFKLEGNEELGKLVKFSEFKITKEDDHQNSFGRTPAGSATANRYRFQIKISVTSPGLAEEAFKKSNAWVVVKLTAKDFTESKLVKVLAG